MEKDIRKLLELIQEVVRTPPRKKMVEAILAEASEDEKTALYEFAGWFDDREQ